MINLFIKLVKEKIIINIDDGHLKGDFVSRLSYISFSLVLSNLANIKFMTLLFVLKLYLNLFLHF